MKVSLTLALFACVAAVSAVPLERRQDPQQQQQGQQQGQQQQQGPIDDVTILQFALSLEHLEAEFYKQVTEKFSEADYRRENIPNPTQTFLNVHHILEHEAQHVKTLQTVITSLGGTPVPPCQYQFPFQTVKEFLTIANALEKVGVSAYNGAVGLIQDPNLQTAAATIDTIEGRHASFLQTAAGGDPFPENFDVALDGRQIITLASPFIVQCSFDLGFVPFAQLQVKKQIQLPETDVEVAFQQPGDGKPLFCNWLFSDQSIVAPLNGNLCKIPPGARGDVYLMITCEQTPVSLRKTDTIIAGPAIVTVDTAHTDSCKEFISGKKAKDIPVNQISQQQPPLPVAPPPTGSFATSEVPPSVPPPTGSFATSEVPPSAPPPTVVDVAKQDKPIQDLFAELQACATTPPPTPPANDFSLPPPQLASGGTPAYDGAPPSSPPPTELASGTPPAYGGAPPSGLPPTELASGAPPAYGGAPPSDLPPTDLSGLPPTDLASGTPPVSDASAPPPGPEAYGAGGSAPENLTAAGSAPLDLTAAGTLPGDAASAEAPAIALADNLEASGTPSSDSDFPVINLD